MDAQKTRMERLLGGEVKCDRIAAVDIDCPVVMDFILECDPEFIVEGES